jgi:predicted nucleic acid-binding protein
VRLVVADTSPINYLLLIDRIDLLEILFHRIILPSSVSIELGHPKAPPVVRNWIAAPPSWVDIYPSSASRRNDALITGLGLVVQTGMVLFEMCHSRLKRTLPS